MSLILGIDLSTKQIDCCLLDSDSDAATFEVYPLGGSDAFEAARNVRETMPPRTYWRDAGVVMVAVEKPFSASFRASAALMRVQGGILACLPPGLDVWEMAPTEWKQHSIGKANASKDEVAAWALITWPMVFDSTLSQDTYDSYAIAYACRTLCERAAESAA